MGKCLMKSTVWMRSIPATSCPWLQTWQQCGSFVGKRLLVEGLFTAFNEGAASAAANQTSSKFLNVTQRLHQTTRTADRSHGDPLLLPDTRDKGLVQTPSPFWEPSQDPMLSLFYIHRAAYPFWDVPPFHHRRPLTVPSWASVVSGRRLYLPSKLFKIISPCRLIKVYKVPAPSLGSWKRPASLERTGMCHSKFNWQAECRSSELVRASQSLGPLRYPTGIIKALKRA